MGTLLLLIVIALGTAELLSLLIIIALMAVLPAPLTPGRYERSPPLCPQPHPLFCDGCLPPRQTQTVIGQKLNSQRQLRYSSFIQHLY
jgi:hypothetical protein